jgi:hypothetical protein
VAITLRPPPLFIRGVAASRLQAAGVALLWSSVGVAWLLFFNVYRIHVDMSAFGDAAFQAFSRGYTRRLPIVVLPYGATCLVWTLALWGAPARISRRALWGIATLCILSIVSTPWAAGAQGEMHDHGYTEQAYQQLQTSHWCVPLPLRSLPCGHLSRGGARRSSRFPKRSPDGAVAWAAVALRGLIDSRDPAPNFR